MMDDFSTHLVWAALATWVLQKVKQYQGIPWVTEETSKLNRWIGAVMALITSFGIHFSPVNWDPLTHTVAFSISGLDFYTIADGLRGAAVTFVSQQLIYHGVVKK